jgi:hypothetical protein
MACRRSGSAPVPSSGRRSATPVHATPERPSWSGISIARTAMAPCARARRSTSASDTGCMPRSASAGPCRSVNASTPPDRSRPSSLRIARSRSPGATCCHTAPSRIRSNARPSRCVAGSPGRRSATQRTPASAWRRSPASRIAAAGATATTSCPSRVSHAASRPLPAPTSSTSTSTSAGAGAGGSTPSSHS